MDVYTLDTGFRRKDVMDEFVSIVWTERFTDSGDVVFSVSPSQANRAKLAEGTLLASSDSAEVMLIDTQSVEDGVLKVTGRTIDEFLNERIIVPSYTLTEDTAGFDTTAGAVMCSIVNDYAAPGGWLSGAAPLDVYGPLQPIGGLYVQDATLGMGGTIQTILVNRGPLFDEVKRLGQAYTVGWSMVPINVSDAGYQIRFKAFYGIDRTSSQSNNPLVRFAASLESLSGIKELRSISGYKTICYAISSDFDAAASLAGGSRYTGEAYAYTGARNEVGFIRRTMIVDITGITAASVGGSFATYKKLMDQHAAQALAEHNRTKVIDGEINPQSGYKFGTDYGLGDIVELQDDYDFIQKARVTEYIRTQDANGSREYPTLSVL